MGNGKERKKREDKTRKKATNLCIEGERFARLGKFDEAIMSYRRAISIDQYFPDAYLSLGFLLRNSGRLDEAIESYLQATKIQPDYFQAHFNLGNTFGKLGRLDEAVASYHKVLAIKPDLAEAHSSLGNVFDELGRWEEAVASFQKALTINPNFAGAYNNLGLALLRQGRVREAEENYREAVRVAPIFAEAHINLADILRRSGRIGEAAKYAGNAVRLAPESAEAHSSLGLALMELAQFNPAVQSFSQAIALKPDDAEAHNQLGNALKVLGRLEDAVASYRKAIAINPNSTGALNNLGLALKDLGRLDDAVTCYRQAIAIEHDQTAVWNNLKIAIKALQFSKKGEGQELDITKNAPGQAAQNAAQLALLDYYLGSFRPHEADESFRKAMATLPPKTNYEVSIPETDRTTHDATRLPDKLIALLYFGRSGTGLLHGLIDGHPEMLTLPGIYLRGFFNAGVWDHIAAKGWHKIPERFADMFAVLFDAACPDPTPGRLGEISFFLGESEGMTRVGENRDETLLLDRDTFITNALRLMQGLEKVDPRTFLLIAHIAFEEALGTATGKGTVFYHIHNPDDYAKVNFLHHVPDARIVMMVREPLRNCESLVQSHYDENNYTSVVLRIIDMLFAIDQVILRLQDSVGVRMEDLKKRPHETLGSLCAWLGVEENPSLYETTAQGKKWWGDPTSPNYDPDKGMPPFDTSSTERRLGTVFSEKDRFVLGTLYYPFSVRFGYREPDPAGFDKDLHKIRPLLDDLLDFERVMMERSGIDQAQLKLSGSYLLFRAALLDRWHIANTFKNYPHMLKPLDVPTSGGKLSSQNARLGSKPI